MARTEEKEWEKVSNGVVNKYIYIYGAVFIHLIVAVLRCLYVIFGPLRLQGDEAQYWAWTTHIDWSYYSKPPLATYLNYLSQWMFGHSELGVRINAIICGMLIGWITYLFAYKVYNSHLKAFWASMLVLVMPFYNEVSFFFSTDSILILLWLLASYFLWMACESDKIYEWVAVGICIGIGALGKYSMLFFILTMFLYLLYGDREKLKHPGPYIAVLLGLILFAPVVFWNIEHDYAGLHHLSFLSGLHNSEHIITWKIINVIIYVTGQLLIISPLFAVMYYKIVRNSRHNQEGINGKLSRFFLIPIVFISLIFIFLSIARKHASNINWTMYIYVGLPILLAGYIVDKRKQITAVILSGITILLIMTSLTIPLWRNENIRSVFPARADPLKKLCGWDEMALAVDSVYKASPVPQKTIIISDQYMLVSELMFYLYPADNIFYLRDKSRMCEFDFWDDIRKYENKGFDAIYVHYTDLYKKHLPCRQPPVKITSAFKNEVFSAGKIIYYRAEPICRLDIYRMTDFKTFPPFSASGY
ncbi:MAG: glycosyltransferase family 39 protein [Bacteroidales bacterium]|jgi:hypothetical protein|nr:glycosyltransferase family 39 protein [Bacteroidales bacterium]